MAARAISQEKETELRGLIGDQFPVNQERQARAQQRTPGLSNSPLNQRWPRRLRHAGQPRAYCRRGAAQSSLRTARGPRD
jgi:hypothetical protein